MIVCCVFCSTFEVVGGVCSVQDYLVYMHHMERPVLGKRIKNRLIKSLNVDGVHKFDCGGLFFVFSLVTVGCKHIWIHTVLLNQYCFMSDLSPWKQSIVSMETVENLLYSCWDYIFTEADAWPLTFVTFSFPVADVSEPEDNVSNGHNHPQHPFGCYPAAESPHGNHPHRDSPENNNTAGSQVEHQKSVRAAQLYDHAFYSTMLLYHGS